MAAPEHDDRPRIFGVGLNKTGTTSLDAALRLLGYETLHWGGPEVRRKVERALDEGRPLLTHLDPRLDAFSDILVLAQNVALLDEQYPGSRFILTVRPVDDWVESRRRHVQRNIERKAAGEYHGTFLEVDEPGWRQEWDEHVGAVRAYFQGRDDLLEIDITSAPEWGPLCGFLGVPQPAEPFPWKNRTARDGQEPAR